MRFTDPDPGHAHAGAALLATGASAQSAPATPHAVDPATVQALKNLGARLQLLMAGSFPAPSQASPRAYRASDQATLLVLGRS